MNYCDEKEISKYFKLNETEKINPEVLYKYLCPPLVIGCLIGVILNGGLLIIGHFKIKNKSPVLLLSLNLATTDTIASLLNGIGFLLNSYLPVVYEIKFSTCLLLAFEVARISALIASVTHLFALAFIHYRGIVKPLHYRIFKLFCINHISHGINIMTLISWIVPLFTFTLYFSSISCQGFQSPTCRYLFLLSKKYRFFLLTTFLIPFILMILIYIKIFIIISKNQKLRSKLTNQIKFNDKKTDLKQQFINNGCEKTFDEKKNLKNDFKKSLNFKKMNFKFFSIKRNDIKKMNEIDEIIMKNDNFDSNNNKLINKMSKYEKIDEKIDEKLKNKFKLFKKLYFFRSIKKKLKPINKSIMKNSLKNSSLNNDLNKTNNLVTTNNSSKKDNLQINNNLLITNNSISIDNLQKNNNLCSNGNLISIENLQIKNIFLSNKSSSLKRKSLSSKSTLSDMNLLKNVNSLINMNSVANINSIKNISSIENKNSVANINLVSNINSEKDINSMSEINFIKNSISLSNNKLLLNNNLEIENNLIFKNNSRILTSNNLKNNINNKLIIKNSYRRKSINLVVDNKFKFNNNKYKMKLIKMNKILFYVSNQSLNEEILSQSLNEDKLNSSEMIKNFKSENIFNPKLNKNDEIIKLIYENTNKISNLNHGLTKVNIFNEKFNENLNLDKNINENFGKSILNKNVFNLNSNMKDIYLNKKSSFSLSDINNKIKLNDEKSINTESKKSLIIDKNLKSNFLNDEKTLEMNKSNSFDEIKNEEIKNRKCDFNLNKKLLKKRLNKNLNFNAKTIHKNYKAIFTTLTILGTYLICWMPALIYLVLTCVDGCAYPLFDIPLKNRVILGFITNCLVIFKPIIDPFIYIYRFKKVKQAIKQCSFYSVFSSNQRKDFTTQRSNQTIVINKSSVVLGNSDVLSNQTNKNSSDSK